ncbi:hypothetical protein WICPIJ_004088 [Wickerhamomyces pijperi]|uniref:Uncharacterized protein n=1 Tax=Wickerhamomyces pijperi TaxID=599730 RepID=A0A9P8Q6J2_WICPI|nr:hypothetical protein WICPIJ_004088 [Wickerhamomyces pijperi]
MRSSIIKTIFTFSSISSSKDMFIKGFPSEIYGSIIDCVDSYATLRELWEIDQFRPFVNRSVTYIDIGDFKHEPLFRLSDLRLTIHQSLEFLATRLPPNVNVLGDANAERFKKKANFIVIRVPCSMKDITVTLQRLNNIGLLKVNGANTRLHVELLDFETSQVSRSDLMRLGLFRSWSPMSQETNETTIHLSGCPFLKSPPPEYVHKPTVDFIIVKDPNNTKPEYEIIPSSLIKRTFNTKKLPQLENVAHVITQLVLYKALQSVTVLKDLDVDLYEALWENRENLENSLTKGFAKAYMQIQSEDMNPSNYDCESLLTKQLPKDTTDILEKITSLINWCMHQPLAAVNVLRFRLSSDSTVSLGYAQDDQVGLDAFVSLACVDHRNLLV